MTAAAREAQSGVIFVAGVDPFRAEGDEHVRPDRQPALGQRHGEQFPCGARVGGRRQDDHLAGAGVGDHALAGPAQGGQFRHPRRVDGRGHTNDHGVGGGGRGRVGGQLQAAVRQRRLEPFPVWLPEVGLDRRHLMQPLLADVDPDDPLALPVQCHCGRQPDVSQANHRHCSQRRPRGCPGAGPGGVIADQLPLVQSLPAVYCKRKPASPHSCILPIR